jgi:hypothetical protein
MMRRACLLALVVLPFSACWGGKDAPEKAVTGSADARAGAAHSSTVAADTLANTRIGGPYGTVLAFRFRSGWTGTVRGVRFYVVRNSDGRTGYSGGTGGTLRVALTRDADGRPGERALATATLDPPSEDAWPLVRFRKPARVQRGHRYHLVFTNVDPEPRRNYVSVNALLSHGHRARAPRLPHGLGVSLSDAVDGGRTPGRWTSRVQERGDRYVPILEVQGGRPGQHLGVGYMEVWVNNPKPVGGDAKVRQLLGARPGRTITGAWLRVRRRGDARAPLQLRIERASGGVLATARVPAGRVRRDAPDWVHVRFQRRVPLGGDLALVAASPATSAYEVHAIRKGTEFGFHGRTVFDGGYAQFTQDGGWVGWDQWGGRDLRTGDLQFALDTAPR